MKLLIVFLSLLLVLSCSSDKDSSKSSNADLTNKGDDTSKAGEQDGTKTGDNGSTDGSKILTPADDPELQQLSPLAELNGMFKDSQYFGKAFALAIDAEGNSVQADIEANGAFSLSLEKDRFYSVMFYAKESNSFLGTLRTEGADGTYSEVLYLPANTSPAIPSSAKFLLEEVLNDAAAEDAAAEAATDVSSDAAETDIEDAGEEVAEVLELGEVTITEDGEVETEENLEDQIDTDGDGEVDSIDEDSDGDGTPNDLDDTLDITVQATNKVIARAEIELSLGLLMRDIFKEKTGKDLPGFLRIKKIRDGEVTFHAPQLDLTKPIEVKLFKLADASDDQGTEVMLNVTVDDEEKTIVISGKDAELTSGMYKGQIFVDGTMVREKMLVLWSQEEKIKHRLGKKAKLKDRKDLSDDELDEALKKELEKVADRILNIRPHLGEEIEFEHFKKFNADEHFHVMYHKEIVEADFVKPVFTAGETDLPIEVAIEKKRAEFWFSEATIAVIAEKLTAANGKLEINAKFAGFKKDGEAIEGSFFLVTKEARKVKREELLKGAMAKRVMAGLSEDFGGMSDEKKAEMRKKLEEKLKEHGLSAEGLDEVMNATDSEKDLREAWREDLEEQLKDRIENRRGDASGDDSEDKGEDDGKLDEDDEDETDEDGDDADESDDTSKDEGDETRDVSTQTPPKVRN